MRIAFIDTYYPDVIPHEAPNTYEERLAQLLDLHFGTSSYYSDAFRNLGWDAIDIIGNDDLGLALWARENCAAGLVGLDALLLQLQSFRPDVVYVQDLSFLPPPLIARIKQVCRCRVVGQHACPWAGDDRVRMFDLVFTSFPHYVERIAALGVESHLMPLAFGQQVLTRVPRRERVHPVTFVGGVNGSSGHWDRGTDRLDRLATEVPGFAWFGYVIGGVGALERTRPNLARAWCGPAWGRRMYEVYAASRIVVNRHGEVSQGFANNMRLFEATGMGALLLTENAPNLADLFEPGRECIAYTGADDLAEAVRSHLADDALRERVARAGAARTLADHTYEKRLREIEPLLRPRS